MLIFFIGLQSKSAGNSGKLPVCMTSPTFGVFLDSLANQKAMISSDATFLPAYISSMLSPIQDLMVPENLHERLFGLFWKNTQTCY
jgi:U3 small nucleolar RNA-associated protein 10